MKDLECLSTIQQTRSKSNSRVELRSSDPCFYIHRPHSVLGFKISDLRLEIRQKDWLNPLKEVLSVINEGVSQILTIATIPRS